MELAACYIQLHKAVANYLSSSKQGLKRHCCGYTDRKATQLLARSSNTETASESTKLIDGIKFVS